MGRKKLMNVEKKVRATVTIDAVIQEMVKENHINLSSLTNKLLLEFFNGKKKVS
jgi:hypothetical protein